MAQWVNMFATKPDNLGFIPGTNMVGEPDFPGLSSDLCMLAVACEWVDKMNR